MNLIKWHLLGILLIIFSISIGFIGCDKEDVLAPEEFAPPTNFRALSMDGQVRLYWTAAPAAKTDDFAGYRILATLGTDTIKNVRVTKTKTDTTLSNLNNGAIYTFSIRSVKTNNDVSQAVTIQWGPTQRFSTIRIFEFKSDSVSGLQFSTGQRWSFKYANRDNIDLWIDGRVGDILLKSPHKYETTLPIDSFRVSQLEPTNSLSMDDQVSVPATLSQDALIITPNKVYFAKMEEGNYVRFQVTGSGGTVANKDRYVDIKIAYNSGTGAWAKR